MTASALHSLRIHEFDNVGIALHPLDAGMVEQNVHLRHAVQQGHKFALRDLERGAVVFKYGQPIGLTSQPVRAGEHVHTHNLVTALAGELSYRPGAAPETIDKPADEAERQTTWRGYRRADGRAATRNEIWILPTVGCVALTAEQVARQAGERHAQAIAAGRIDGIHAFGHPHGCSQLGDDLSGTRAVLAGLAANPNAAGVLFLGLGCESNQLDALVACVPSHARHKLRVLSSQTTGDEMAAAGTLIDELVSMAQAAVREELPLSALTVGLKCGGSDGFSGLTANPLLGRFCDRLTHAGGRAILTEIPEIFGAEEPLLQRSISRDVFDRAAALVNGFKRYYLDQGLPVSENPSPGNLAGGITTLEEKSLGAVQKAGRAPLCDVLGYGAPAMTAGLNLLEAPGNDAVSSTALAASGATLVLFTTGRGTPLGFAVPCMKVASNEGLAQNKPHWIDFDASLALREGPAQADADFLTRILATASGEHTAAERGGQRAIAIWKRGVTL